MMHPVPKLLTLAWLLSLSLTAAAQTDPARRQQAVPVLIKETARRVFAELGKVKDANLARQLADSLSRCPAGCDPFAVIDQIDKGKKWKNVREKLADLELQAARHQRANSPDSVLAGNLAVTLQNFAEVSGKDNLVYQNALTGRNQKDIKQVMNDLLIPKKLKGSGDLLPKGPIADAPDSLPLVPLVISLLIGLGLSAVGGYLLGRRKLGQVSPPQPAPANPEKVVQTPKNQANQTNSLSWDVKDRARRYDDLIKATGHANPLTLFQALNAEANGADLSEIIQLLRNLAKADDTTDLIAFLRALIASQPTGINPPAPVPPNPPSNPPTGETLPLMITPQSQQPVAASVVEQPEADVVSGNVFYLPPPSEAGIFDAAQASPMPSTTTSYRFMPLAKKPGEARFRFEAEPNRVERLLTYRHYMIKPACDSTDELLPGQTRVQNVTDGTATLENDQWRVTKKALIRYQ